MYRAISNWIFIEPYPEKATTLTFWDERKRDQDTFAIWEIGGLKYLSTIYK